MPSTLATPESASSISRKFERKLLRTIPEDRCTQVTSGQTTKWLLFVLIEESLKKYFSGARFWRRGRRIADGWSRWSPFSSPSFSTSSPLLISPFSSFSSSLSPSSASSPSSSSTSQWAQRTTQPDEKQLSLFSPPERILDQETLKSTGWTAQAKMTTKHPWFLRTHPGGGGWWWLSRQWWYTFYIFLLSFGR